MALDIGQKRVGVALSDESETLSSALCVLDTPKVVDCSDEFRDIVKDKKVDKLVFGLPKTLSGELGPQAKRVKQVAEKIASVLELEYEFVDERNSSAEAKLYMRELGFNEKKMRGKIDMVAAQIFLQSYLDNIKSKV